MAKPITWRNIAGPSFNNSALGQGVDAFRSAAAGFGDLTDSLFKTQDRIDQGYTNEAIRQSLQTGRVDPNLNPRADSAAVYEALLGKQKFESDLETAKSQRANIASQIGLRDEQTKDYRYKNSAEYRALQERATKADIAADEAVNSYNTWRLKIGERDDAEAQRFKTESRDLDRKLVEIRQGAYQEYIQQNVAPGATPTLEQEQEARLYADSAARDPAARQILEQYAQERGYLPESWDLSTWGRYDALNDQNLADLAKARAERAEKLAEAGLGEKIARSRGDLGQTMIRDGKLVPLTDEYKDIENMGNYREALSKIQTLTGANVTRLLDSKDSSDEKRLIEFAREKLPNASLLAGAIEPYLAKDGELDVDGFRDLLADVGQLTMFDSINRARREKGLPPIEGDVATATGTAEGGDATAEDVLGPTVRGVETKVPTPSLLDSYTSRIQAAEEIISGLEDDADEDGLVPVGGGVRTLKAVLARAQTDGKPSRGELPGLERNLQMLENLLRQYQEAARLQAEYDAAGN